MTRRSVVIITGAPTERPYRFELYLMTTAAVLIDSGRTYISNFLGISG